jgi:hypothetical protein
MKLLKCFCALFCLLSFVSCGDEGTPDASGMNTPIVTSQTTVSGAAAVTSSAGFTFEFSDSGNNYIITLNTTQKELLFTIEDRNYAVSTCIDSVPKGYGISVPSESNCFILPDRFAGDPKKQLLEVIFKSTGEAEPEYISKIYGIKNGEFTPLEIYDNSYMQMVYTEYLPETTLIPTETNKFMIPPTLFYSDVTGNAIVTILTYTFDANTMTFTKTTEPIEVNNPLYYGYAAYTAATDLYSFFTDRTLSVDIDGEISVFTNNATGESDYYIPVADPRFTTLAEFEAYIRRFFSEEIAAEMFRQAPQKYRDIGGVLHTLQINTPRDPSLGSVLLTAAIGEDVSIAYPTEQFRTQDGVTRLDPGTDFVIDITRQPAWTAVSYKYPYK